MKNNLTKLTEKHKVSAYWVLAFILLIAVTPIAFIIFTKYPDFGKDIDAITNGKGYIPIRSRFIHKLFFISKEFMSSLPDLPDFQCGTGRCGTGRSVAKKYYLFLSA